MCKSWKSEFVHYERKKQPKIIIRDLGSRTGYATTVVETTTWSQLWETQSMTSSTFTFFIASTNVVMFSWDKRNSRSILRYLTLKLHMIPESKGGVPVVVFGGRKTSLTLESSISRWQGTLLRRIRAFQSPICILVLNFWRYSRNIILVIHTLEFAFQMLRHSSCLLKARGIFNLQITNGLNFSVVVKQRRAMVSLSLANLPTLHFFPCNTKLQFGTPF